MATVVERYHPPDARGRRTLKGIYAVFRDPCRQPPQKEVSLGTLDRSAARLRMAELERREAMGLYDPWTDPPHWKTKSGAGLTVLDAMKRFLVDREQTNGPVGLENYRSTLTPFGASLPPGLMLIHLSADHVEAWLGAKQVRPTTLKAYRDRIGIFVRWCVATKLTPPSWDPLPARRQTKQTKALEAPKPKYYTPTEFARLLTEVESSAAKGGSSAPLDRLLADVIRFTAATGLRRGEVCALRWSAVHLEPTGLSYVSVEPSEGFVTKNGKSRAVPLLGEALTVIERRAASRRPNARDEDPVFPAMRALDEGDSGPLPLIHPPMLTRRLRRHLTNLGMREARGGPAPNFHSLRHTFGTDAVSGGASVYAVQEAMGHARIQTTQGYAKVRPAALHAELSKALAPHPSPKTKARTKRLTSRHSRRDG